MKKIIALILSIVLVLVSLSCIAQAEEGPKFVTIQEWLQDGDAGPADGPAENYGEEEKDGADKQEIIL